MLLGSSVCPDDLNSSGSQLLWHKQSGLSCALYSQYRHTLNFRHSQTYSWSVLYVLEDADLKHNMQKKKNTHFLNITCLRVLIPYGTLKWTNPTIRFRLKGSSAQKWKFWKFNENVPKQTKIRKYPDFRDRLQRTLMDDSKSWNTVLSTSYYIK